MSGKKVRIGIIGAGNIAQSAHIPAYLKQDDVELVAVCDLNKERAQEVANKYGMKYAVTDINELTAIKDIDAVSVCTWNNAHAPAVISAARAGKHILCEKPMTMTVADAEEMRKAVKESGIVFMMGFVSRFSAESKWVKEMADKGKFGNIYYAKAQYIRRRGTPLGWFTDLSKSGGGPVIDIGVHVIDVTWYLMGKPKPVSVSAATYSEIGDYKTKGVSRWEAFDKDNLVFNTEDSANGMIRFENGATMLFEASWAINGKEIGLTSQLFGSKAGVRTNPIEVYGEDEDYLTNSTPTLLKEDAFANEIRHFLDCIKEGREPIATVDDGVAVQRILNGIYESARLRKEILL